MRDLAQDRLIAASILRPEAERPLMQLLKYPPSPDGDILSLDVECDCPFLVAVHSSSEGLGITHTRRHGSRCGEVIAHWLDPQQVHRFSLWLGEG